MSVCGRSDIVDERLAKVLDQQRESTRFLSLLRTDLEALAEVVQSACAIPEAFDLDTAVGDQLTIIGKWLGWPRCHCICITLPAFGYPCDTGSPNEKIVGYCEGVGYDCGDAASGTICIDDDETYRGFLYARAFQLLKRYDEVSLNKAAQAIWGETASAVTLGGARTSVAPGRALTIIEDALLPVAFRVLPFAPGVGTFVNYTIGPSFNYGSGWAGYCENVSYACPQTIDAYACA